MEKHKNLHVIIIMADQLRTDVLGTGFTPNIDRLTEEGARFDRAYCACPLCVPARGAFFTGTYPNRNGSLINPWEPADARYGDVRTGIASLYDLMEEEWDCIHSGKQHLFTQGGKLEDREGTRTRWISTEKTYKEYLRDHDKPMPGGPKFRMRIPEMVDGRDTRVSNYSNAETGCYQPGEAYYFDRYFTDRALEGLKSRNQEKPLLLNVMFLAPHPPLHIPNPWYSRVKNEDFDLPENVGVFYPRQSPLQMYNLTGIAGAPYDREHWKEAWRVYLGLVAMLDNCVGRILAELKEQNIYDDSLILFTSDHGEMLGSHGLFQKMCMYEESSRVPLYIKFPKGFLPAGGRTYRETVSHVDLMPTLCDYLGLMPFDAGGKGFLGLDGDSLMPLLRGERGEEKGRAFIQYDGNGSRSNFQRCVVKGNYKLIVDMFKDECFAELYDVEKDRQETRNLVFDPEYDRTVLKLWEELDRHMKDTGDLLELPRLKPEKFRREYGAFPAL